MKKVTSLYSMSFAKPLAFTALFAALCCTSTLLITVPLPFGYFNTGDIFVLLAGWCLGPLYGSVAAATGSALADVLAGFALYAPATFIIKGVDALVAYLVWSFLKKLIKKAPDFTARALSAIAGEALMLLGYFAFESVLYGFGGATASLLGNGLQGLCCGIGATLLCAVLSPVPSVKKLFPMLSPPQK